MVVVKSDEELREEWEAEQRRRRRKAAMKHRKKVAFWEAIAPRSTKENLIRRRWLRRNRSAVMAIFRERLELQREKCRIERKQEQLQRWQDISFRRAGKTEFRGSCHAHSC